MCDDDRSRNQKKLDELIETSDRILEAQQAGDKDCPGLRKNFGRLYGEILAQLDGETAPFESGDWVRVIAGSRGVMRVDPLEYNHPYRIYEIEYDGKGCWMVTLEEMKDRADQIRFGHHQFEKVALVAA